jgi:hypothetical protein
LSLENIPRVQTNIGGAAFGIQPANTLVQATLIGEGYLVEIETDALLS